MRITFSLSNLTAGLVTVLIGVTSSIILVFQAATAGGATVAQTGSWIFAVAVGTGLVTIGLSLYYRMPILAAWSTPGAALLITSLSGIPLSDAIGAFIFSSFLTILSGVTGLFEKTMAQIPRALASAMLAGILFHFGMSIFTAMQHEFLLIFAMFMIFLIGKKWFPRFAILAVLCLGISICYLQGSFHPDHFQLAVTTPSFTMPTFSLTTLISIGIPLFIVTMTSQNVPGAAIMEASGYQPRFSPIMSWLGTTNLILAPFGGFTINLAAITAALCLGKEADPDPNNRYKAAVFAGVFYLIVGLFGATLVALFTALPFEMVIAVAGLALLSTISSSLKMAFEEEKQHEAALVTLLVSASGMTLCGIGAAFWGLIAGIMTLTLLKPWKEMNIFGIKKYEADV